MLFNSLEFAIFLPVVFLIYWWIGAYGLRIQNTFLLVASYVFYGRWDPMFLGLILLSSATDYLIGIGLSSSVAPTKRKLLLGLSLTVNLGLLGLFKYFNFFLDSLSEAFTLFGNPIHFSGLELVLPVGISFYTFQTLSYTIDVYKRCLEPSRDVIGFFAFVSFFPQLVAGPIERASNLLPQIASKRSFDYQRSVDGMRQILWGLFKKVAIADSCAELLDPVFSAYGDYSAASLIIAAFLFSIQIYGDFSGYSDIAIGTARLFGFNLMQNFAFPYFSRDIAEFWRRWHISLSTWFRDYLYIPLGGSRVTRSMVVRNMFIIFLVSGFWHGANWTFIVWGGLNAIYFLPLLLANRNRVNTDVVAEGRLFPSLREGFQILSTFLLTILAWIFFRSASVTDAFAFIKAMFSRFDSHTVDAVLLNESIPVFVLILFGFILEWLQRTKQHGLEDILPNSRILRYGLYYGLVVMVLYLAQDDKQFIYFQF